MGTYLTFLSVTLKLGPMLGTFEDHDAEITLGKCFKPEILKRDAILSGEARENNHILFNRSRDSIDLNGVLNDNLNFNYQNSSSSNGTGKFDSAPKLDLTLRSNSSDFESHVVEKRQTLGHSNASAFTR